MEAKDLLFKTFFTLILSLFALTGLAQKPATINLINGGKVSWLHYDFIDNAEVRPLTALFMTGKGEVTHLEMEVEGVRFVLDQFGKMQSPIQAPFLIKRNSIGRIEQFQRGYDRFMRFEYDFDGRLTRIKNGSYQTLVRLDYNFDGQLTGVDKGGYKYLVRFDYNFDDEIDRIKNGSYSTIYDFRYNWDDQLEGIKNSSYKWLAQIEYYGSNPVNVADYGLGTEILIGYYDVNHFINPYPVYGGNSYGQPTGHCSPNCSKPCCAPPPPSCGAQVTPPVKFFEHSNHQGVVMSYNVGNYASVPHHWNDKISSIKIPHGLKVIVFEHSNFAGACKTITGNWTVYAWNDYWNDRISSFKIVPA